ncbi:MAG TPA: MmcQ/YjbR family DNA-binding protein [Acidimicrobiia bacterium]|nr:MmcQ/YjbR family DNA-binding protein [Acidimicrobiia bacterium]
MPKSRQPLDEVRKLCLALPEVEERLSHGAPTWFVRGKKTVATVWDNHHDDGRLGLICAAPPGVQQQLVDEEPERFYVPPYVGGRGWIGVRLDRKPDWNEIAEILDDAYRCVAPKKLIAQLDEERGVSS